MISQRVIYQIISDIDYKPGTGFRYGPMANGWYIQHWQNLKDCTKPASSAEEMHTGRKWYISQHSTISEVVQTAFMAVLAFEEHEVREYFQFQAAQLFAPHIHHKALQEASSHRDKRNEMHKEPTVSA